MDNIFDFESSEQPGDEGANFESLDLVGGESFVDLSGRSGLKGPVVRVLLRQEKGSLSGKKVLSDTYLIGLVEENLLPKEGHELNMLCYNNDGAFDYTVCTFKNGVSDVTREGNVYHFNADGDGYRLEILDSGN